MTQKTRDDEMLIFEPKVNVNDQVEDTLGDGKINHSNMP